MSRDLVFEVEKLLLLGKTIDIIVEGLAENHTAKEVRQAHEDCMARWCEEAGTTDRDYARQLRTLRHLYDRSYKLNDFKSCTQIHKQIEALQSKNATSGLRKNAVAARINREGLRAITQEELAALLQRDAKTIQRWSNDGLPHHGTGKGLRYDWYEVEAWRERRRSGQTDELDDKARKLRAEADLAEMEAAEKAGQLLEAAEVSHAWTSFLGRLKVSLDGLPDRAAPQMEDGMNLAERAAAIRRELNSVRRDLVAEAERTADHPVAV